MDIANIFAYATYFPIIFARIRSLGSSLYSSVVSLLHSTQETPKETPKISQTVIKLRSNFYSRRLTSQNWERLKTNRPDGRADSQELEFLTDNSV